MNDEFWLTRAVSDLISNGHGRPDWDDYFMATALLLSTRSNCGRLHVGCVLVSQGEHRGCCLAGFAFCLAAVLSILLQESRKNYLPIC